MDNSEQAFNSDDEFKAQQRQMWDNVAAGWHAFTNWLRFSPITILFSIGITITKVKII